MHETIRHEMGIGFGIENVTSTVFKKVKKSRRLHPFKEGMVELC